MSAPMYSGFYVTHERKELRPSTWFDYGEHQWQYHVERRSLKTLKVERAATFFDASDARDHAAYRDRQASQTEIFPGLVLKWTDLN